MLGGMGSSGLGNFATWVKGLIASAFRLFPLGGANGGFILRKKNGVPGPLDIYIYTDGTQGNLTVADGVGNVYLQLSTGGNFNVRQNIQDLSTGGNKYNIQNGSGRIILGSAGDLEIRADGSGGSIDTAFGRAAPGVWAAYTSSYSGRGWLQNSAGSTRLTADATNATATMSNLTDLSQTVIAGRKYIGHAVIFASNSTAAEGLQFDFNGGSATFTSFVYGLVGTPIGATIGTAYATSAATALTATTATTGDVAYLIAFEFVCNAAGTVIPRGAEVSHTLGTATFRLGSYLLTEDCP